MQLSPAETLIVNSLIDGPADWPLSAPHDFEEQLIEVSDIQSTHALLYHQLQDNPVFRRWPISVCDSLKQESQRQAAIDLLRRHELSTVLQELAKASVNPIVFKGTALAHSHYAAPSLRTRNDTDLLIEDADLDTTNRLLRNLGYIRPNAVSGTLISYEFQYRKTDKFSVLHVLDVHVRINNSQFFAQALTYNEINDSAVPIAILDTSARTPSLPHALIIACMHRAAHMRIVAYYNGDRPYRESDLLIWLYDIHLLATSMIDDDWLQFNTLSAEKKSRAICLDALQTTEECFHTQIPSDVIMSLSAPGKHEASAVYLTKNRWKIALAELTEIPGLQLRLLFLWENIFPSADYMRQKYSVSSKLWLPALYLHRAVSGLLKRLRR